MNKLVLKSFGKTYIYNPSDVVYIGSSGRKIIVHTASEDGEFYGKLHDVEEQLPNCFARCHKCYSVNLDFVSTCGSSQVTLVDGTTLPVGRSFKDSFNQALEQFLSAELVHE